MGMKRLAVLISLIVVLDSENRLAAVQTEYYCRGLLCSVSPTQGGTAR